MDDKYDSHNYENKSKSKIIGFEFNVLNTVTNGTMADIIDGEYLFAGTGSVVNKDIPPKKLAIERSKLKIIKKN